MHGRVEEAHAEERVVARDEIGKVSEGTERVRAGAGENDGVRAGYRCADAERTRRRRGLVLGIRIPGDVSF